MVRKLFKHEFLFYIRTLLPIQILLVAIAALNRFIQIFENDSTAYNIVFVSSVVVLVVGALASVVLTAVIIVVRFYKNMFSAEGYLTHTLPVTPSQHIFVKLASAVLCELASLVSILLAVAVSTAGEVFTEILKALKYLFDMYIEYMGTHGIFYILEFILCLVAASISSTLLYYACITGGQLFNKNRIFAAVGIYFVYYILNQALGTVFTVAGTVFYDILPIEKIGQWISDHPFAATHWIICGITVLSLIISAVYFIIIRFIMRRKLNLE